MLRSVSTLLLILLCHQSVSANTISMRVGYAYDIESNELLYIENHHEVYQDGLLQSSRVLYTDTEKNVIAKKNLDFSEHLFLPEFTLSNIQTGHLEQASFNSKDYEVAFSKTSFDDSMNRVINLPANGISDAGFDNFIKHHWMELMQGKSFEQEFLIPSMLKFVTFKIYMTGVNSHNNTILTEIIVEPENLLTRTITGSNRLFYLADEQQLLRYEGVSNLRDEQGKNYRVIIDYRYKHLTTNTGQRTTL